MKFEIPVELFTKLFPEFKEVENAIDRVEIELVERKGIDPILLLARSAVDRVGRFWQRPLPHEIVGDLKEWAKMGKISVYMRTYANGDTTIVFNLPNGNEIISDITVHRNEEQEKFAKAKELAEEIKNYIIRHLAEENKNLKERVEELEKEKKELEEKVKKLEKQRKTIWFPINNEKQLKAVMRKILKSVEIQYNP